MKELNNNPNYYENLLKYSKTIITPNEYQISLDLKRTFPENSRCMNPKFIEKLKNILNCYSIRNSTIGYLQGMNFIVGRILLIIENEERAFWIFTQILEKLLPMNFYNELAGIIVDTYFMQICLEKYLPEIYFYIKKNNIELTVNNFIHRWYVSLFTQALNEEMIYNFFDYFFLDGHVVLFKMSLCVFSVFYEKILKEKNFENFYQIMNNETFNIINRKILHYFLAERQFEINNFFISYYQKNLNNLIYYYLKKEAKQLKRKNLNFIKKDNKKIFDCNPKWPFCIYLQNEINFPDFFVYKTQKNVNVIEDYYYNIVKKYPNVLNNKIDEFFEFNDKDFICEMKKHNCDDSKIVEASRMFLEEKNNNDNNNNINNNENNNENISNFLYKQLSKEKSLENSKNSIANKIQIKNIIFPQKEIKEKYNERINI